ncbi:MAG: hypothetical protein CL484_03750 [Acidobacteria bacterium]|nr:hypothetical protein [Acidobacteriota bacterium]
MSESPPTIQTIAFVILFLILYVTLMIKRAAKNKIDIYDLAMLCAVVIVPSFFVVFSGTVHRISHFLGVAFPFVLLFGVLFVIVFLYLYKVIVNANDIAKKSVFLVQELSLLREELANSRGESGTDDT